MIDATHASNRWISEERQRVLIVEDHEDSAQSLQRLLSLFGYEVRISCDGQDGVDCAESFAPSAALIDLTLPKLDGFAVASRLRQSAVTRNSLLVAMTGWLDDAHCARARAAGFDRHLVKPMSMETLIDALSGAHA